MDLIYDLIGANMAGEHRHAKTVMRELGISYSNAIPHTISDRWQFVDCKGVPAKVPEFLSAFRPTVATPA